MTPLIAVLIQNLPGLIGFAKEAFAKANPDAPIPTDAEIKAAYVAALASSLSIDSEWLASHPE